MPTKTWSVARSIFFTGMALATALVVYQAVGCMSAPAQQLNNTTSAVSATSTGVPATVDELIRQMSLSAAIIFTGEVAEVRHPVGFAGSPEDAAEGVVEIDFRVDQAVLGVKPNSIYTLREWSGLWAGATNRYRKGQRLLMILRAPNAVGFSSPVHGFEGAIPLRGIGQAPGPDEISTRAAQWMVDVRWLQAQTRKQQLRTPGSLRGYPPDSGGRLRSEGLAPLPGQASVAKRDAAPLLVRALPGPWIEQDDPEPQVEALSHVLGICASRTGS